MSMKAQILFLFSIYCFLIGSTPVMKAQTGKFYSTDKELSNKSDQCRISGPERIYLDSYRKRT